MRAKHGSELVRRNVSLVDCRERLHQLLANFLIKLTDDKLLYLAHVTDKLHEACIGSAACTQPVYRYNRTVFQ